MNSQLLFAVNLGAPYIESYMTLTTVNTLKLQILFAVNLVYNAVAILPILTVICT